VTPLHHLRRLLVPVISFEVDYALNVHEGCISFDHSEDDTSPVGGKGEEKRRGVRMRSLQCECVL